MEPPAQYDKTAIRNEKAKVLQSLRPIMPEQVGRDVVAGQYGAGASNGQIVKSYLDELGKPSTTETFVAVKAPAGRAGPPTALGRRATRRAAGARAAPSR